MTGGMALFMTAMLGAANSSSPVADSAMKGDREAVRTLLKQGADVSAAQGDGMTPLHWAAERGDAPMAEMLLYAGANVAAVTRIGQYTAAAHRCPSRSCRGCRGTAQGRRGREGARLHDRRHAVTSRRLVREYRDRQGVD